MIALPKVAVIGAGAGGIAMGIALKRAGLDFTIYEKSDGVGGTWRDNTYPGAACDVPSHLYSYSFEPHPWWTDIRNPTRDTRLPRTVHRPLRDPPAPATRHGHFERPLERSDPAMEAESVVR